MTFLAWALYDLANTFFAVAMLSFYFPLWVVEDHGAKELVYSIALAASMICVALLMPICGAISDATHQRVRYLWWTTLGCVGATFLTGLLDDLWAALALFAIGNVCYQLGTVFYDALLWQVARPQRLGAASSIGAAFGYLGSMTGLAFLWPFVRHGGHQAAFIPSAVFFLLFAVPCFVVLRDPASLGRIAWGATIRQAFARLRLTLRSVRAHAGLWRFFLASFFSLNAINTVLVFMAVYTKRAMGFGEADVVRFFLVGQAFAVAGSLAFSRVIDRVGPKRTLAFIWTGWIGALGLASLSQEPRWLWVVGPLIGFCLGSTWATSRVLIIELSPKDQLAEILGLAGLLGRASSILGPLLWGLIVWDPARYRQAVLALIGLLGIGLWLFRRVPDPRAAVS
ncbi:MAG: MFS transporter [Candidatus Omnitrophica bacterium]|nr:MFS transporter [Candidatus Omnitrophota bacterium]